MKTRVALLGMATAVPPYILHQSDVARHASAIFGDRFAGYDRLARVFETTGILRRHSVKPIEWYATAQGWPERTRAYLDGAGELFLEAARKALERAGVAASEIDCVVTVSSTGIATPSLEARAGSALGLRSDVARIPVFGLGCAGGVTGLAIASRLALAQPGSTVLMVCVELCTLSFRGDSPTKANIVATSLFGDGAAACVVRSGSVLGKPTITGAGEHLWDDTLAIMGWDVDDAGLGVIFDRAIPPFVEERLAPAMDGILARLGLTRGDIDQFVCHPGGAKVVVALETALGIEQGSLVHEREVLSRFGNMSAPTVFFVLERALADGLPGRSVLTAMGPGFTASAAVLEAA